MGLEGGPRFMKIALIIFNVLVLIMGGLAIGLGVWSLTADYGAQEMSSILGSDLYEAGCFVVITGGSIVVFVSLMGCCGAFMESRRLLATYFGALILLLVLFTAGAVAGFFFKDDLEEELEKEMTKTLKEKYDVDTENNKDNRGVTDVWNKIQKELKCCGVSGGLNSTTSWFMWQQSVWFTSQITFDKDYVPNSCCNIDGGLTFNECTRLNTDITRPVQVDMSTITDENPALFSDGCLDKVKDEIEDHIIAISVVAVIVLVVMLLCIMFAVCVFLQIGKQNMVV